MSFFSISHQLFPIIYVVIKVVYNNGKSELNAMLFLQEGRLQLSEVKENL